jgi:hypothetical protein
VSTPAQGHTEKAQGKLSNNKGLRPWHSQVAHCACSSQTWPCWLQSRVSPVRLLRAVLRESWPNHCHGLDCLHLALPSSLGHACTARIPLRGNDKHAICT